MALKGKDADEFEPCKIVDSEEIENLRHQLKSLEIELLVNSTPISPKPVYHEIRNAFFLLPICYLLCF